MKNLENILDIAASLVKEGKATIENAIEKAIEIDNEMCEKTLGCLVNKRGYNFIPGNTSVQAKGIEIVKKSIYERNNA